MHDKAIEAAGKAIGWTMEANGLVADETFHRNLARAAVVAFLREWTSSEAVSPEHTYDAIQQMIRELKAGDD